MAPQGVLRCDLIAIGGSAGSLATLLALARHFPRDFGGAILVVAHIGQSRSILPQLLAGAGRLTAGPARDGEKLRAGHIHAAPPDCHLLVEDGKVRLSRGPREHFTRPAIDPLFRSAARSRGPRVIGVVLSGSGSDGAAGLDRIREAGGRTVVEDPTTAPFPDMPRAAMSVLQPDFIAPAEDIPDLLLRLSAETAAAPQPGETIPGTAMPDIGRPLTFSCPDCGGALRLLPGGGLQQYACHIGHRFSGTELLEAQHAGIERGINVALRMLNEQAEFARRMIESARHAPLDNALVYWERFQAQAEEQAELLRQFLERRPTPEFEPEPGED